MTAEIDIHGIWSIREECLSDCVRRVADTFQRLGELRPEWQPWYKSYRTMEDWSRPAIELNNNLELIREELLSGQIADGDGGIKTTLGYSMHAFAGPAKGKRMESSAFQVVCCKKGEFAGPNILSITLPTEGPAARTLMDAGIVASAIGALADIWRPDWLIAGELLTTVVEAPYPNGPVLGWVNYLALHFADVTCVPARWHWWEYRGNHQIFIYDGGIPSAESPEDVAAFTEMLTCIQWKSHDMQ